MIYVGIDDTNNAESVGTAKFTRQVASKISEQFSVYGVTRHQFYINQEIDYTVYNFCAVIHVDADNGHLSSIFDIAKEEIIANFNMGSNPGLAVAHEDQISPSVMIFGADAKKKILTRHMAIKLAENSKIELEGFGKTKNGVIGALAGVGLASAKNDGRFIQLGQLRDIKEPMPVKKFLKYGIDRIFTIEGVQVFEGIIFNEDNKPVKPSPVNGEVVLFVEPENKMFRAVNID